MLNTEGINKLEVIMLANEKYYNQYKFGEISDCGTSMCGAGFCRLLEVGKKEFAKEVQASYEQLGKFSVICEKAGVNLLGLTYTPTENTRLPQIFSEPQDWPEDLRERFYNSDTPRERVALYIEILRTRTNDDGSIRELES